MRSVLVTGGAGFIGSYIVDAFLASDPDVRVTVLDSLTYAADRTNLSAAMDTSRMTFVHADICDLEGIKPHFAAHDLIVHAAAESHVDRSFSDAEVFLVTNVMGTQNVLRAARACPNPPRVVHISTDEVYGPRDETDEALETDTLAPTNPYSASKAAAEMLAFAAGKSFDQDVVLVRPNNVFGARQFPEKLLPKFILSAHLGDPITIHGTGLQRRRFLSAAELAEAVVLIADSGVSGEVYNVGNRDSYSVKDIVGMLSGTFGSDILERVTYVEDRPYNDACYSTCINKIAELGWKPSRKLSDDFDALAREIIQRDTSRRESGKLRVASSG